MTFTYPSAGTQFIYPIPSSGGGSSVYTEAPRTITAGEAIAKQLTLAQTPADANSVTFGVREGGVQVYGVDYTVTGTTLSWSGLGLDGILAAGDVVTIQYFT